MAEEPEEKARAKRACSSAATAFSKLSLYGAGNSQTTGPWQRETTGVKDRFGLELLVYSYAPTGLPTPVWANVVDREI